MAVKILHNSMKMGSIAIGEKKENIAEHSPQNLFPKEAEFWKLEKYEITTHKYYIR